MGRKKDKEQQVIIPYDEDVKRIDFRNQPTTKVQKADLWIQDTKGFAKRYWWLILLIVLLIGGIPFIYVVSTTPSAKVAVATFLKSIGVGIGIGLLFILNKSVAAIFVFVVGYKPVKKLMARRKISFNELNAEKDEVLTIRKTSNEVILYRDRQSLLKTLFYGKEKIHIDFATFDLLERVGEPKILHLDGDQHEILRITIIPEAEMAGEEVFIDRKDGKRTFNTNYRIEAHNVEEYILKSALPDVDPKLLRRNLINLTKQLNIERNKNAFVEKEFQSELDRRFLQYVTINTPRNFAQEVINELRTKAMQEPEGDLSNQFQEYLRQQELSKREGVYE